MPADELSSTSDLISMYWISGGGWRERSVRLSQGSCTGIVQTLKASEPWPLYVLRHRSLTILLISSIFILWNFMMVLTKSKKKESKKSVIFNHFNTQMCHIWPLHIWRNFSTNGATSLELISINNNPKLLHSAADFTPVVSDTINCKVTIKGCWLDQKRCRAYIYYIIGHIRRLLGISQIN